MRVDKNRSVEGNLLVIFEIGIQKLVVKDIHVHTFFRQEGG